MLKVNATIQKPMLENTSDTDVVFKCRDPKMYFLVRSSKINNGRQIIAICCDITRIKEMEKTAKKMKAIFFSSVAHELRTPLNSIIPIIKIMIETQHLPLTGRRSRYLNIILNSALHLENVIEDALDMSRLENNKFTINKELFEVRVAVSEISEIMRFPFEQKGIELIVIISESVPLKVFNDQKRYKQILFNLLGNAIKFTFQGTVTITVEFMDGTLVT